MSPFPGASTGQLCGECNEGIQDEDKYYAIYFPSPGGHIGTAHVVLHKCPTCPFPDWCLCLPGKGGERLVWQTVSGLWLTAAIADVLTTYVLNLKTVTFFPNPLKGQSQVSNRDAALSPQHSSLAQDLVDANVLWGFQRLLDTFMEPR